MEHVRHKINEFLVIKASMYESTLLIADLMDGMVLLIKTTWRSVSKIWKTMKNSNKTTWIVEKRENSI